MVVFVRSPMGILVSALASIAIAAFIYFVIVKPETDRANEQVDKALQQNQPNVDRANRIQQCIAAAQGDVNKIAKCNQ
jgi:preprotein translocase subunit YajC